MSFLSPKLSKVRTQFLQLFAIVEIEEALGGQAPTKHATAKLFHRMWTSIAF